MPCDGGPCPESRKGGLWGDPEGELLPRLQSKLHQPTLQDRGWGDAGPGMFTSPLDPRTRPDPNTDPHALHTQGSSGACINPTTKGQPRDGAEQWLTGPPGTKDFRNETPE